MQSIKMAKYTNISGIKVAKKFVKYRITDMSERPHNNNNYM